MNQRKKKATPENSQKRPGTNMMWAKGSDSKDVPLFRALPWARCAPRTVHGGEGVTHFYIPTILLINVNSADDQRQLQNVQGPTGPLVFKKHEKPVLFKVLKHVRILSLQSLSSLVMVFVYYLSPFFN